MESIGTFKDGLLITYESWYENGKKKSEENYNGLSNRKSPNGKKCLDGVGIFYFSPVSCHYDFIRDGEYQEWYENGKMKELGNYKSGKQDGLWKSWYKNGKLQEMGTYKAGYKDGVWKTWNENGKLESTWQYDAEEEKWLKICLDNNPSPLNNCRQSYRANLFLN